MCKGGRWGHGGGGWAQTDKTPAATSLNRTIFFDNDIGIAFYQSNFSTVGSLPARRMGSIFVIRLRISCWGVFALRVSPTLPTTLQVAPW
jgi:hypothetical protein